MASIYTSKRAPIRGPYLKHAFAKSVLKGEDAWLQQRDLKVAVPANDGTVTLDAFGIFDGHGGKQAATFASKHMTATMLEELQAHLRDEGSKEQNGVGIPVKQDSDCLDKESVEEQLATCSAIKEEDWALWRSQDAIVEAMPQVLANTFQRVESDFFTHGKVSGSTATMATICGWEAVIANVGDSCAYMDTGGEVVLVSGNHRLDDNKAERARCLEAGRELSRSAVEGRPTGPLRVWPGGLNMSRTIGDFEAGDVVTCEPEVRQVTLPVGGARIVIASDGLWDAVNPKTALHHVRGMPASKAVTELVQMASKSTSMRDDITVLVIDVLSSEDERTPAALQRKNGTAMVARSAGSGSLSSMEIVEAMSGSLTDQVTVLRPLETSSHTSQWRKAVWERRLVAVQTTYGALLPPDLHSSSDMSTTMALSDTNMASSFETASMADFTCDSSPNAQAGDHLLFGSFDDDEQEDAWETVPTKSKGRKHSSELDATAGPPTKEPRADLPRSDSLSSDGSALMSSSLDNATDRLQPRNCRAPNNVTDGPETDGLETARDGGRRRGQGGRGTRNRGGRGRGRGGDGRHPQRQPMGRIEEAPEGGSPTRREITAFAGAADGGAAVEAGIVAGPQGYQQGRDRRGPRRDHRRQNRGHANGPCDKAGSGEAVLPVDQAVGKQVPESCFSQPRAQHISGRGRGGRGRGRGRGGYQGRGGYGGHQGRGYFGQGSQAQQGDARSDPAFPQQQVAHAQSGCNAQQQLVGEVPPAGRGKGGPQQPRSFRGRGRGRPQPPENGKQQPLPFTPSVPVESS